MLASLILIVEQQNANCINRNQTALGNNQDRQGDNHSRQVLAYEFGNHCDAVFKQLQALLNRLELRGFTQMDGEPMNDV